MNCLLSIDKKDSIIIVDEAEAILKTADPVFLTYSVSAQKGTVNRMLENNVNKVIWILNYTNLLDESTLRRFNYSIEFNEMPKSMLQGIASSKLKTLNIKGELMKDLLDLCGKYKVSGASIDNMIRTIQFAKDLKKSKKRLLEDVKNVLEANSKLLYGSLTERKKIQRTYDINVLNTSISSSEIVLMVKNAIEYSKNNEIKTGIRMLFFGLSGTGKTEFARYISEVLDKKLIIKKTSDILDKYIGESEKQIKKSFEEAIDEDAILLFDEADSFFSNRLDARHGWERTMVNEFLTQVEEFSGLLICTTNVKQLMDPAMERRFHIMAEFKALNEFGIKTLLSKYFSEFAFTEEHITMLEKWNSVTPGDFASLHGRVRFMPNEKINSEYIVSELSKIQKEKSINNRIGFVY